MCGIAGFASTETLHESVAKIRIERMVASLRHRGPDDESTHIDQCVALGHARLSILDLSPRGRQPMSNEDGTVFIVFNGEIYNFKALRQELQKAGYHFRSDSDSEVLLLGYEEWGIRRLLQLVRGMFSFAIFDRCQQKVYLVRDHFGMKPLFYARRADSLVFASEPKALLAHDGKSPPLDRAAALLCLHHFGVPAPRTMYEGYRQLEPAHWLQYDVKSGAMVTERYWNWRIEPEISDFHEAKRRLWEAILDSVEHHLVADVDVGLFLSGGLDSSLLAAACAELGRKPTCITIALSGTSRDESPYAAALCRRFGLPHWVEPMHADNARPFDTQLADMFDEPFAASSALSAAYLAQRAATQFKVMLAGEGGDELFGGYRWYRTWVERYGVDGRDSSSTWNTVRKWCGRSHYESDPIAGYGQLLGTFSRRDVMRLFDPHLIQVSHEAADGASRYRDLDTPHLLGFDRLQMLDMEQFLPTACLTKMDRTAMAFGLEVRVPYVDRVIADLAGTIDHRVRVPGGVLKSLIKEIAKDRLPNVVLEKEKTGFSTPVLDWFPRSEILADIAASQAEGCWWHGLFSPRVVQGAARLRGSRLWRFWHLWRWAYRDAASERGHSAEDRIAFRRSA